MRVITPYPIYTNGRLVAKKMVTIRNNKADKLYSGFDNDNFSFIDGKSSSDEIKAFQNWWNTYKSDVKKGLSGLIKVDGTWNDETKKAWASTGIEYTKANPKKANISDKTQEVLSAISQGAKTYTDVVNIFKKKGKNPPTPAEYEEAKKKPMSTNTKLLIAGAVISGILLIVYITKKK